MVGRSRDRAGTQPRGMSPREAGSLLYSLSTACIVSHGWGQGGVSAGPTIILGGSSVGPDGDGEFIAAVTDNSLGNNRLLGNNPQNNPPG